MLHCSPWVHKRSDMTKWLNNNKPMENCRSPYSLWAALMSKLKCSYWGAFSLVLFWMKNNACPPPPKDGETLYSQQKQDWELTGSHHELLIAKFRLKLKKVGKPTGWFRYDLNKIPYNYTVEVRNRFKGTRSDRVPEELWEVCDIL